MSDSIQKHHDTGNQDDTFFPFISLFHKNLHLHFYTCVANQLGNSSCEIMFPLKVHFLN